MRVDKICQQEPIINQNKQVVVVYVEGDFTKSLSGSHERFKQLLQFLCKSDKTVLVYSYRNHVDNSWTIEGIERFKKLFPTVTLHLEESRYDLSIIPKIKRFALFVAPRLAKNLLSLTVPKLTPVYSMLRSNFPDATLIVNFTYSLLKLNGCATDKLIVDTHDVNFIKKARKSAVGILDLKVLVHFRLEMALITTVKLSVAISNAEYILLSLFVPEKKVVYLPVFAPISSDLLDTEIRKDIDLLFVGSSYEFNVNGLGSFLESNTWLKRLTIHVAGSVCNTARIKDLEREWPKLKLLGYVEDLSGTYKRTRAALSTVDGTGLKMKILEALRHNVPVFVSPQAMEGLPPGGENCIKLAERHAIEEYMNSEVEQSRARAECAPYLRAFYRPSDIKNFTRSLSNEH